MHRILVLPFFVAAFLGISRVALAEQSLLDSHYATAQETCHDILEIRKEINRINDQILQLLAERTAYVKRAGDLKSKTTKIADDRQRVAAQEALIINKSIELGLPPAVSLPTFRAIVDASIEYQQDHINHLLTLE